MERKTRTGRKTSGRREKDEIIKNAISDIALSRLALYSRYLRELLQEGKERVTSEDIAERFCIDSAQVRKDLSYIGKLGMRGHGYYVERLFSDITEVIGRNNILSVIVVGVGKLGTALIGYPTFSAIGFDIKAAFDNNPEKIGKKVHGIIVKPMPELAGFIKKWKTSIAVLTVPGPSALDITDQLIKAGIEGIINFAPIRLNSTDTCLVKNIDMSVEFEVLRYNLLQKKGL